MPQNRNSPRKSLRKTTRNSPRKSLRKTTRKSPRKSLRKTTRNSPRKSLRKTTRKSPRKSLRKTTRRYEMKHGLCVEITQSGKQCTRQAAEGSVYCTQHGKKYGEKKPVPSPYSAASSLELPDAPRKSLKAEKSAASSQPIVSSDKISIGDYSFRPIGKIEGGARGLIEIESTNLRTGETHNFKVYISNSEGGLLRYCSERDGGGYEKGRDYVTETFINMDLQKFINTRQAILPVLRADSLCIRSSQEPARSFFGRYEERLVDIPSLEILKLCPAGECFNTHQLIRFLNMDEFMSTYQRDVSMYSYPPERLSLRDRMTLENRYYQEFLRIVKENYQRQGVSPGNDFSEPDISRYWKTILLDSINTYLMKHIQIAGPENLKYLYSNSSTIKETETTILINNNYYSLPARIDRVDVDLIFSKFTFTVKNANGDDISDASKLTSRFRYVDKNDIHRMTRKPHCVLVNIVPSGGGVMFNGTYDKIVSAGFLVYKPFEHVSQVSFTDDVYAASYQYSFIGNVVGSIFPTMVVCEYPNMTVN